MINDSFAEIKKAALLCALCWPHLLSATEAEQNRELALAEQFVDAFYAFDPKPLADILSNAGKSQSDMLFYQGWAQGGNYIVKNRLPCKMITETTVSCSITVQDDLVLALGIDFDVTDTFVLSLEGGHIVSVETSSNDPQLYLDARKWVKANREDLVQTSCEGAEGVEPNPVQCVRDMLQGYKEYARNNGLEPRLPN